MEHPIDTAARIVGTQAAMAKALGVTRAAVWQWKDGSRKVPDSHVTEIERLTAGAVPCEVLRPDCSWMRIPDESWPHPGGRPFREHTKRAPPEAA